MSLFEILDRLDKLIFVIVNHDTDHAFLDYVMLQLRNPYTWIPLYAFVLYYAVKHGKTKFWQFAFLSVLTFSCTDSIASRVLKPMFGRLRPCCDPVMHGLVRTLTECGGIYGFPSNHAANHFGLASFWYWSIWLMTGKKWSWLWIWAAAIAYAQVYVGKHYPLDVLAGSVFGWMVGTINAKILHRWAFAGVRVPGNNLANQDNLHQSLFHN